MSTAPPKRISRFCKPAWAPEGEEPLTFGNPQEYDPEAHDWKKARAVFVGVPADVTTSFGHATAHGPYAIRYPSARRIEVFVPKYGDIFYERTPIYDLGDLALPQPPDDAAKEKNPKAVDRWMDRALGPLRELIDELVKVGKIPFVLGGEHSITYYSGSALALRKLEPVWIHFDAHLDAKKDFGGMKRSHTAPMYWLLNEGHCKGEDFIQIGQRQWDVPEKENVDRFGVSLYPGWEFTDGRSYGVAEYVGRKTKGRNVAITFDIDVYDSSMLRCTGTPEPWGLTFSEVIRIIEGIDSDARLAYFDMVEVGYDPKADPSFIEGGLAAQTILHTLCQRYVR